MGITNESQLMDINAIAAGCEAMLSALELFVEGGNKIIEAGYICDSKALSIDGKSLRPDIVDAGTQIANMYTEYANYIQELYNQAVRVYTQQVNELNEYYRQQAAKSKKS